MDRQKELEIIRRTGELFNDDVAMTQMAEVYEKYASDALKISEEGAKWDALGQLPKIDGQKPVVRTRPPQQQAMILFMAAVMRCMGTRCRHVRPVKQVALHVFLAPRVLSCKECILSFADVFNKTDAEGKRSDECDLCLKQGVKVFRQFSVSWNGYVFSGDICPECLLLLN